MQRSAHRVARKGYFWANSCRCGMRNATTSSSTHKFPRVIKRGVSLTFLGVAGAGGLILAWPGFFQSSAAPLAPNYFTPTTIISSESCASTGDPSTKIITLRLPQGPLQSLGVIHSIYIKDDDIQVERPYTPLNAISENNDQDVKLWIKRYEHGEVGRWLHSKKAGDILEIRGPVPTWDYNTDALAKNWDEIVMISGGTGITPFFQFILARFPELGPPNSATRSKNLSHEVQSPHITLIHASRESAALPPPLILGPLQKLATTRPESFTLRLFVDSNSNIDPAYGPSCQELTRKRVGKAEILDVLWQRGIIEKPIPISVGWRLGLLSWFMGDKDPSGPSRALVVPNRMENKPNTLFLVSGPESMVEAIAGPRPRQGSSSRGRLGVLGDLGFGAAHVRRL